MKSFQLDPSSWHYKLVMYSNHDYKWDCDRYGTDICTYTKNLFFRIFVCLVLSALVLSLLVSYISMGVWIYDSFIAGKLIDTFEIAIPAQSLTLAIMIVFIYYTFVKLNIFLNNFLFEIKNQYFNKREEREKTQQSFFKLAYRSWKDKYCIKLEVMKKE